MLDQLKTAARGADFDKLLCRAAEDRPPEGAGLLQGYSSARRQ